MNQLYWIWLQQILGCGSPVADRVVKQGLSAKELYENREQQLPFYEGLEADLVKKLKESSLEQAEALLRRCQKLGIWVITIEDEDYPERLWNICPLPLLLYGKGERSLLNRKLLITMVGSRECSKAGAHMAYDLAQDMVQYGFGVVSGLAMGIDSYCHTGALEMGGLTIGVAACGLDRNYPTGNTELRRRIAEKGVLVSEYQPGMPVYPGNFHVRNRILSALSLGTIVVEARRGSGALITADHALEQGRDVFAVPTHLYNHCGMGNLQLLAQGATPVISPESVVEEYSAIYGDTMSTAIQSRLDIRRERGWKTKLQQERDALTPVQPEKKHTKKTPAKPKEEFSPIPEGLDPSYEKILHILEEKPLHAEELASRCGMEMQELLVMLSELEIDGLVKAYPGKQFGR